MWKWKKQKNESAEIDSSTTNVDKKEVFVVFGWEFSRKEDAERCEKLWERKFAARDAFEKAEKIENKDFVCLCIPVRYEDYLENIIAHFVRIDNEQQAEKIAEYIFEEFDKTSNSDGFCDCKDKLIQNVGKIVYIVEYAYDFYGDAPGEVFTFEELKDKLSFLSTTLNSLEL